jgi:raffinose/stachyose/melibiose transport system substrate-binding protein
LLKLRHLFLVVILAFGAWALWPAGTPAEGDTLVGAEAGKSRTGPRKYTIKIAPRTYRPGRRPKTGDPPLKALRQVGDAFEKLLPDTSIEFIDAPVDTREWIVTQAAAGMAPDIIDINVQNVWQDVQKGWYIPLDRWLEQPNPFVKPGQPGSKEWWDLFKYQAISRGKAAPDGKMYCLTLDMIETGIFYNKKIFRELGLKPPKDWAEFLRMQKKIEDAGYTPMLCGVGELADWGVDLMFDQLYRDIRPTLNLRSHPKRDAYQKGYLDWDELTFLHEKGFFSMQDPRWPEVFRLLKQWRKFMPKDIGATDLSREFIQGRGAMLWSSSGYVARLADNPDLKFDWGVFYLPPVTKETSPYGGGHDMCVIGGAATQFVLTNSSVADTGNVETSERVKRCVAFLQYLTLPENCDKIVNETTALLPNIVGVDPKPLLKPFDEILRRDFTTTKWIYTFDLRFSEITNRMLFLYMTDGITLGDFMDWMVANVTSATSTVKRRKSLDMTPLQQKWNELAPLRATMEGLPDGAR